MSITMSAEEEKEEKDEKRIPEICFHDRSSRNEDIFESCLWR